MNDREMGILRELINQKFENVDSKLNDIHYQVLMTNGRVNKLEDQVKELEIEDIEHPINCPARKEVAQLNRELLLLRTINKYPKFFIIIFVVLIAMIVFELFMKILPTLKFVLPFLAVL